VRAKADQHHPLVAVLLPHHLAHIHHTIVTPVGEAGVADALEQRAKVGGAPLRQGSFPDQVEPSSWVRGSVLMAASPAAHRGRDRCAGVFRRWGEGQTPGRGRLEKEVQWAYQPRRVAACVSAGWCKPEQRQTFLSSSAALHLTY
jgi:hypothetical protein